MGDEIQITINKVTLEELLQYARKIVAPEVTYKPDTEEYLKSVIQHQRDKAGMINAVLTHILYPN
jgi:hypothetical protein